MGCQKWLRLKLNYSKKVFSLNLLNLEQKVHFLEDQITYTFRSKHEKLEGKDEASFDTPFMIQSHAGSMKKIMGALMIYQLTSTANPAQFTLLFAT